MSQLTYNGIVFDTIQTTRFEQVAQRDPTETDYLFTKITIGVKAVINSGNQPATSGETPADTIKRLRGCLMSPCKKLIYNVNGVDLVNNPPDGVSEDPNHGPKPISCNILKITEATFLIEYVVETAVIECCSGGGTPPYLSNKWEETHSINEDMYTRRTIKGRVIFRADAINSMKFSNGKGSNSADFYRGMIAPPDIALQPNFVRKSMEFVQQADGLALDYTIVDEEQYVIPPLNTTRFTGTHTVTVSKGAIYNERITVKCWGNALTSKSVLLSRAVFVISNRVNLAVGGNGGFLKAGYIQDQIHENAVEVQVEIFRGARPTTAFFGLNVASPQNITALDYIGGNRNSNQQPDPGMRGTANLAMLTFQDYLNLCASTGDVNQLSSFNNFLTSGQATNTSFSSGSVVSLPQMPTSYNQAELSTGIYTNYHIDIDYRTDYQVLQQPYMNTTLTSCSIVNLGMPIMYKVVQWQAEKWNANPTVPDYLTSNSNSVLIHTSIKPTQNDIAPDGMTTIYRRAGEYIYAVKDISKEDLAGGIPPYSQYSYLDSAIPQGSFSGGLADNGTSQLRGGPSS